MAMVAAVFNHRAPPHKESPPFMLQMQDLMSKSMRDFKEGSIVKGRVLEIRPREVLVDIGYKSEGVIPTSEFDDIESLEVGDEVEVLLERLENDEGMVVLSKEKAAYRQNWNKIAQVFAGDGLIKGKVKSVVKGWTHGEHRRRGVSCQLRRSTSFRRRISSSSSATPTTSRSSRSTTTGRTSSSAGANSSSRSAARSARNSSKASRSATPFRARSRTSPISARSSTSMAWTACSTSPT